MANKQIDELAELTTASGVDLLPIYDLDGTGSEKTKKIQVNNVVGGWILVAEYTLSNEQIDETLPWDGSDVRTRWYGDSAANGHVWMRFNNDASSSNYKDGRLYQDGTSANAGYTSTRTGVRVINNDTEAYRVVEMALSNEGIRRYGNSHSSQRSPSNTDQALELQGWRWYNTADDVTSIRLISGSSGNVTGTLKVYKWNDVRIN